MNSFGLKNYQTAMMPQEYLNNNRNEIYAQSCDIKIVGDSLLQFIDETQLIKQCNKTTNKSNCNHRNSFGHYNCECHK